MGAPSIATRLTERDGLRHPLAGACTRLANGERMAAAVSNAGGVGFVDGSPEPPHTLELSVERLRQLTDRLWGVELSSDHGAADLVSRCLKLGLGLVAFRDTIPPDDSIERLRAAGASVWLRTSSPPDAYEAAERGVTGIVADVADTRVVGALRDRLGDLLLLAGGGIRTGSGVAAALRAGADGAWVDGELIGSGGVLDPTRPARQSARLMMAEARTEIARARVRADRGSAHTDTSCSRNAWLSDVLRSVDWERRPIISAAGSP